MAGILAKRQAYNKYLFEIPFTTLSEYLCLLQQLTRNVLHRLGHRVMLYLAAAVSDFYIPSDELVCFCSLVPDSLLIHCLPCLGCNNSKNTRSSLQTVH